MRDMVVEDLVKRNFYSMYLKACRFPMAEFVMKGLMCCHGYLCRNATGSSRKFEI